MRTPLRRRTGFLLGLAIGIPQFADGADSPARSVVGWVESTQGLPVAGAFVSLMGSGLRGGGVRAIADERGRFVLPPLPAGLYTLRAVGLDHVPSAAQRVTLLPDNPTALTVSLQPVETRRRPDPAPPREAEEVAPEDDSPRSPEEWRWLVRHRQRSVLEAAGPGPTAASGEGATPSRLSDSLPWATPLAGSIEVVAATPSASPSSPGALGGSGAGSLELSGNLPELGTWALDGLLSESESSTWRMAAEFILEPAEGHALELGAGFGESGLEPEDLAPSSINDLVSGRSEVRSVGAVRVRDRWRVTEGITASLGARYSYFGFLAGKNHIDPTASLELTGPAKTRLVVSADTRSTPPGGDLFALSTLAAAPMASLAELPYDASVQRLQRYGIELHAPFGPTSVATHVLQEDVRDQILTSFEMTSDGNRTVRTKNGGSTVTRGVGLTVTRRLGRTLAGAVTYTWGRTWRPGGRLDGDPGQSGAGEFHDVVARIETVFDMSGTRIAAYCRLNTLDPAVVNGLAPGSFDGFVPRFDVRLAQRLPLLASLTRADWELLLSVRNLFYEEGQAGMVDELAVANPQRRVVGGVSVRF